MDSGPPVFRSAQLLDLARAGIVNFIGPAAAVVTDDSEFIAESANVAGSTVRASVLRGTDGVARAALEILARVTSYGARELATAR